MPPFISRPRCSGRNTHRMCETASSRRHAPPSPCSGVSSPGRSPARMASRHSEGSTMSDPMRHRNATPPYGAHVPANAGADGVMLDTGTTEQSPTAESVGAVPGVEADAQDSRVLEQQLIEQGGWHELIELLLN